MSTEPLTPAMIKDTIQRHWTNQAAIYDDDTHHGIHSEAQRQAWLALIQRWTGAAPLDVLDVGCGTAFLALHLATLGHRVVAIDGNEAMLALARSKASQAGLTIDFRLADVVEVPSAPASFDLVIERCVLWTLPDPATALTEWARVVRPGGRLVLIERVGRGWVRGSPGFPGLGYESISSSLPLFSGRPAAEIAPLVEAAGWADLVVEPLPDEVLWGGPSERHRFALSARKPG